jgi:hypothetical protein
MADQPEPAAHPEPAARPEPVAPVLAPPAPVQVNSAPIIAVGTIIWFVGFVVLLPFYSWLGEHHHRVWLWTCLAGWILGGVGYLLRRRHRGQGRTI